MRTVHETEALRPSDPVPKAHQHPPAKTPLQYQQPQPQLQQQSPANQPNTGPRLKIILKTQESVEAARIAREANPNLDLPSPTARPSASPRDSPPSSPALGAGSGFSTDEAALPLPVLFRQCRRQLREAEEEAVLLAKERAHYESAYGALWREKEALLTQAIKANVSWNEERDNVHTSVETD